jgi:hypothetical protein
MAGALKIKNSKAYQYDETIPFYKLHIDAPSNDHSGKMNSRVIIDQELMRALNLNTRCKIKQSHGAESKSQWSHMTTG